MRRYWIPAMLADDAPGPNGDPVRVRLLGENFVLWRDGEGRLCLFDEYCMHRGASLALGRCEGDGLRCIYHHWKFAADGAILETPNYKKSNIRERRKAPVYSAREAGGLIWVYLGPADKEPSVPRYPFIETCDQQSYYHSNIACNYVQLIEGVVDTAHNHLLHVDPISLGDRYIKSIDPDPVLGDKVVTEITGDIYTGDNLDATTFLCTDTAPEWEVEDTLFGCHGVCLHDAVADGKPMKYGMVSGFSLPFFAFGTRQSFVIAVPIDDTHTSYYSVFGPLPTEEARRKTVEWTAGPDSSYEDGWYRWTANERWGQDRSRMSEIFTGLEGVCPEDFAVNLSMGAIYDRSKETLVPADLMIVRIRRRLLEVARALQQGLEPYHLQDDEARNLGGVHRLVTDATDWQQKLVPNHEALRLAST